MIQWNQRLEGWVLKMEEGPQAREGRWPLDPGKSRKIDPPLETLGGTRLIQPLTSRTVREHISIGLSP